MKQQPKFKKDDKVKLSHKVWGNNWFDESTITKVKKNGNYNIQAKNGDCEMFNVEEKDLKIIE